jgi:hypothetical protein
MSVSIFFAVDFPMHPVVGGEYNVKEDGTPQQFSV